MPAPRRVTFTEYALSKMRRRDILEKDVLTVLARPSSAHRHRRDGRSEVGGRIQRGRLLVVYQRRRDDVLVINAMRE